MGQAVEKALGPGSDKKTYFMKTTHSGPKPLSLAERPKGHGAVVRASSDANALPALRSGCTQEFLAGKKRSRFYHAAIRENGPNKKVRTEDKGLLKNAADTTFTVISATRSGIPDWRVKAPPSMTLKAAAKMVSGAYSYGIFSWLGRSFEGALNERLCGHNAQRSRGSFELWHVRGCGEVARHRETFERLEQLPEARRYRHEKDWDVVFIPAPH